VNGSMQLIDGCVEIDAYLDSSALQGACHSTNKKTTYQLCFALTKDTQKDVKVRTFSKSKKVLQCYRNKAFSSR